MPGQTFQVLFCERFHCPPEAFEEQVFARCLHWQARLVAPLLRRLKPGLFTEDFRFIRCLGAATDLLTASAEAADFHRAAPRHRSFWRGELRLRVSGRKAMHLAHELFGAT